VNVSPPPRLGEIIMLRRNAIGLSLILGALWAVVGAPSPLAAQGDNFAPSTFSEAMLPTQDSMPPPGGAPGWGGMQEQMSGPGGPYYSGAYGGYSGYGGHGAPCAPCGEPCCEPCCDPCGDCCDFLCGPVCVVTESFVYMQRTSPNESILVRSGINAVVDASQLEFEYQPGFDISVLHEDQYGLGTEVRALWLEDYSDDVQVRDFSGPNLFINTFLVKAPGFGSLTPLNPPAFTLPQDFSVLYTSETASVELNYHEPWSPKLRMLMGVRYARLDEEMILGTRDAVGRQTITNWVTDNDLIGFQIGGHYILWEDYRCRLEAVGRGGIFHNAASVNVHFADGVTGHGDDRNSEDAMIGEFKLAMTCQLGPMTALTVGYQMLGFDGVVLASEQLSNTGRVDQANIAIRMDTGSVVFHGGFVGLEIRH
jgi:hypothetical protein